MGYQLHLGDCLEIMPTLASGSVDAIICDLPYGVTSCKWDSVIPLEPLWAEYKRVIRSDGAIVLFGNQPFTSKLITSNLEWFRYCWVWDKVNRFTNYGNVSFMPLRKHEDVVIFSQKKSKYFPQMTIGKSYTAKRTGKRPDVYANGGLFPRNSVNHGTRFPSSILPIVADVKKEMGLHPTQKPVALLEYLVRTYTNAGETVLDNTMGSGTTGVACMNTGRKFIGIEKDAGYFEIAKRRIESAQPALMEVA